MKKEQIIEKAIQWLSNNTIYYASFEPDCFCPNEVDYCEIKDRFLNDFRKAMEEE